MSTVEQIEKAILALPKQDVRRLADWLLDLDEQLWDQQIKADVTAGKLDRIAEQAIEQHRAGQSRRDCLTS